MYLQRHAQVEFSLQRLKDFANILNDTFNKGFVKLFSIYCSVQLPQISQISTRSVLGFVWIFLFIVHRQNVPIQVLFFIGLCNSFHTLAVLLFFSLVYALSCDCCGLCNRQWWHDTFCKRRIVYHELLLGGWQDRLPLQKSLHTHCKGSPSRPNVWWWLIRFSQIMMLCLSPFKERVSVINGKNTKYKKTKSALIKVGGWTIIRSLWWHSFFAFLTSFCSHYIHNLLP